MPVARRKGGAVQVGKLVGMKLHRQAKSLCLVEHARNLLRREGDALAKTVDRVHQPYCGDRRQHLIGDQIDVGILVALGFRRQCMRAEEARAHRDFPFNCQPPRRAQRLRLVLEVEPVARLDLDRRNPFGNQGIQARQRLRNEFVLACGPERLHRRDNAAAGLRNLLIRRPGKPRLELVGAVAGMDEVGMAIDQPGRDQPSPAIDDLGAAQQVARKFGF